MFFYLVPFLPSIIPISSTCLTITLHSFGSRGVGWSTPELKLDIDVLQSALHLIILNNPVIYLPNNPKNGWSCSSHRLIRSRGKRYPRPSSSRSTYCGSLKSTASFIKPTKNRSSSSRAIISRRFFEGCKLLGVRLP